MSEAAKKNDKHNPKSSYANREVKDPAPGTNGILVAIKGDWITILEPLYRTADQRIVPETNLDGRWLAYPKGVTIRMDEAERMGILALVEKK